MQHPPPRTPRPARHARWRLGLAALALALACGPTTDSSGSSDGESHGEASSSETSTGAPTATATATITVTATLTEPGSTSPATTAMTTPATSASASTDPGATSECPSGCVPDIGPDFACDVWSQDCPEGMKCTVVDTDGDNAWDSARCKEVTGDAGFQEPCVGDGASGDDDCALGYMCWNMDEDGAGYCVGLCGGSPEDPMCPEGQISYGRLLCLCLPVCDPIAQDCVDGEQCVDAGGGGFTCVLDASEDAHPPGSPCEQINVCNPGSMCLNADYFPHPDCEGASGCCAPYCDVEQGVDPNPTCTPFADDVPDVECAAYYEQGQAPAGFEHVGVCITPI